MKLDYQWGAIFLIEFIEEILNNEHGNGSSFLAQALYRFENCDCDIVKDPDGEFDTRKALRQMKFAFEEIKKILEIDYNLYED